MPTDDQRRLLALGRGLLEATSTEDLVEGLLEAGRLLTGARTAVFAEAEHPDRAAGTVPHGADSLEASIVVGDRPFGTLVLADKAGGEFDDEDAEALGIVARWGAMALHNARLTAGLIRQRDELSHALTTLEAATSISRALVGETDLERVLEIIADRVRTVVGARTVLVSLVEGDEIVLVMESGAPLPPLPSRRFPLDESVAARVLERARPLRLPADGEDPRGGPGDLGLGVRTAVLVPLIFHGERLGVLAALDRIDERLFTADDARLLDAFGASAATAVVTAESIEHAKRRRALEAADDERLRWARELHDDTLQELAAVRLELAMRAQADATDELRAAIDDAVDELDGRISALRALIADLRPTALDELGLGWALQDLAERTRMRGVDVAVTLDRLPGRPAPAIEHGLYRLAQEALANVVKHADATRAEVSVACVDGRLRLTVRDDGRGFAAGEPPGTGYGIVGMRERVAVLGGCLDIDSRPGEGTSVTATIPADR